MSKPADSGPLARPHAEPATALARLIDTSNLAQVVPQLAPEVLHLVIRHHGLEACGPLVAAATPQQVRAILDLDLWRPAAAGGAERFDAARFGAWLEALMDEGEAVAARIVAEMDESLAVTALSRLVRVFDPAVFEPSFWSDDERGWSGPAPSDDLECEIGGYVIRARATDMWDAIVGLLTALADGHPEKFDALMRGCRGLSHSTPEADGLDDLLLARDQALHDAAVEREERRVRQGYLSAEDARAFLTLARRPPPEPVRRGGPSGPPARAGLKAGPYVPEDAGLAAGPYVHHDAGAAAMNPIAAAYLRALNDELAPAGEPTADARDEATGAGRETEASLDAVAELMIEVGIPAAQPRGLLGAGIETAARLTPLEPLMAHAFAANPSAGLARHQELTFLANALLAGCSLYARPFTIREAWDAAAGVCNLGLDGGPLPETYLVEHDLVAAFETGWRLLHEEVSLFVADCLIAVLTELRTLDGEVQQELDRLRRELTRDRAAGTPWRAAESLEVMAILDTPAWACLCGLLSECPVMPDAVGAVLERRSKAVSATAYTCFTTRAQIDRVKEFGVRLRALLLD